MSLFYRYWDLHTKKSPRKTSALNPLANRKRERWIFTSEKTSFAQSHTKNEENSPVHNRGPRVSLRLLNPTWFASLECSIETFIEEKEKPKHSEENETWRCFYNRVSSNKRRNTNWNSRNSSRRAEWIFEWIHFKRLSSLPGMLASFERHRKRNPYPVSIINDLVSLSLNFHESCRLFWLNSVKVCTVLLSVKEYDAACFHDI